MQTYDMIMLGVLIAATLFGLWKGFAWQVASLGALFASYLVAYRYRYDVAEWLPVAAPWNTFAAMLLLYVGTSLLIWIAFRWVHDLIDRVKLTEFDHQIGALFGLTKGAILCMVVTLFAVTLLGDRQREAIVNSRSGYYIAVLLDKSNAVMPVELTKVLEPYLHQLDGRLEQGRLEQGRLEQGRLEQGGATAATPSKPAHEVLPPLELP